MNRKLTPESRRRPISAPAYVNALREIEAAKKRNAEAKARRKATKTNIRVPGNSNSNKNNIRFPGAGKSF
jgi:hypothetical protein